MTPELIQKIENDLATWDSPDSAARKHFEDAAKKWDKELEPLRRAIAESERITEKDLSIRIV